MRLLKISLLVFVLSTTMFSQNFFPLKVGNVYQVKNFWSWWSPGGGEIGTNYFAITIVNDTVIDNETFFQYSNNVILKPEFLFNYDSLNQKVYVKLPNDSTLRLGIDFNVPLGSSYISYLRGSPIQFTSGGISSEVVMGDTFLVYSMQSSPASDNFIYKFADNIGLSYFRVWGGIIQAGYQSNQDVISAIIDSVIYNPLVLSVDSLYPVSDRPINTFPYLLTIPYTVSYSAFIDSFYIDVKHIRSDTLVQNKIFNLPKNNPSQLTFYLDSLQVGDKIKLRATITDTSIYNNVSHYPDTGWVVMNVLSPVVSVENENISQAYNLSQNYPNPFNPSTKIKFTIPPSGNPLLGGARGGSVTLKAYDVLGSEVATLVNEEKPAGEYEVEFNGTNLPSGIYFYQLKAGSFVETRKMILLK